MLIGKALQQADGSIVKKDMEIPDVFDDERNLELARMATERYNFYASSLNPTHPVLGGVEYKVTSAAIEIFGFSTTYGTMPQDGQGRLKEMLEEEFKLPVTFTNY